MVTPDLTEMADMGSETASMGILDFIKRFGGGLLKGVGAVARNVFGINPAGVAHGLINKAEQSGYLADMSYMMPHPFPVIIETIYGPREIHEVCDPSIIAPGEAVSPANMELIRQ